MREAFPFTASDVLFLLGIEHDNGRSDVYLECPFCGSSKKEKKLAFSLKKDVFCCKRATCASVGNSLTFYAAMTGLSNKEAYHDICSRLNIKNESGQSPIQIRKIQKKEEFFPEEPLADIKVRNHTYRFLSEVSDFQLTDKNKEDLKNRGFSLAQDSYASQNYLSLPDKMGSKNFPMICKRLHLDGCELKGVPGFFQSKLNDNWSFVTKKRGIMIPYVNFNRMIQGYQVRKDDDVREVDAETGKYEYKYSWITSKYFKSGTGSKSFVHYACDFKWIKENYCFEPVFKEGVVLTEGAMKADLFFEITNQPTIAVPGVNSLNLLLEELEKIKAKGVKKIYNGYDMDYMDNPDVQKAEARLKEMIEGVGFEYIRLTWNPYIGDKMVLKGIDDFYAYKHKRISF